jgi:hypothetical protein
MNRMGDASLCSILSILLFCQISFIFPVFPRPELTSKPSSLQNAPSRLIKPNQA